MIRTQLELFPEKSKMLIRKHYSGLVQQIDYEVGKIIQALDKKNLLDNVDYIFLGAWNFKDEIFKKEKKFLKKGGKFITHVPFPKII